MPLKCDFVRGMNFLARDAAGHQGHKRRAALEASYRHGPHLKFRARDPKSEEGSLLWNNYVFFMKWKKLVTLCLEWVLFFVISPIAVPLCLRLIILMKKNIVYWIRS